MSGLLVRARIGAIVIAAIAVLLLAAGAAQAATFFFSTGNPDGLVAMASRPAGGGLLETEAADDFVLSSATGINHATFVGLLPSGTPLSSISDVAVEIYRVFPLDSNTGRTPNVPTRTNSPSDISFDTRDSAAGQLTFTASLVNASFNVANSVNTGIHQSPNQTTGGEGAVTGEEVAFDVTFTPPFSGAMGQLPAGHYFFVPQVGLSSGVFYWLSAPKPIVSPGTPFSPDLQTWMRNANLNPDWLRVGTDIIAGGTTYNGTFSLAGCTPISIAPQNAPGATVGEQYSLLLVASGGSSPYSFSESGALPPGLSLAPDGTVSGKPTAAGSFTVNVKAVDSANCSGTQLVTFTVAAAQGNNPGPKPPAPLAHCTLAAKSSRISVRARARVFGILAVSVRCDQDASVVLSGKLVERKKKRKRNFGLPRVTGAVHSGVPLVLTLKMPRAAQMALVQHIPESVRLSLTATDTGGSSTATTTISKLTPRVVHR